jgi:hypothetical protein
MPTHRLYVSPNSGNIGVGTETPAHTLDVFGDINFTGSLLSNGVEFIGGGGDGSKWTETGSNISYVSGNVGIGTTDPTEKLEVNGNVSVRNSTYSTDQLSEIKFYHGTDNTRFSRIQSHLPGGNDAQLRFFTMNNNATDTLNMVMRDGSVGIGTTNPTSILHINTPSTSIGLRHTRNTVTLETFLSADVAYLGTFTNHSLGFYTNNLNRVRITDTGNVGIGTDIPTQRLHVDGDILATGDVTAFSDQRQKFNIQTIDDPLAKLDGIRGVYFNRLTDSNVPTPKRYVGVIAQEVEKVLPEVVYTNGEGGDGIKSVAYANMVGLLCEATKALKKELDDEKSAHQHTRRQVDELLERLSIMETK